MKNSRALSALIICEVLIKGRSLSDCFPEYLKQINDKKDQALVKAICFGVCRWFFWLDAIAKKLLNKPLKHKDKDIYCLILVGLYQLSEMRIAEHAAINETVNAVKDLQKIWAKNLVNAILRGYQREKEMLDCFVVKNTPRNDETSIKSSPNQNECLSRREGENPSSRGVNQSSSLRGGGADEAIYSHPKWLIGKIKKSWPNDWKKILDANNQQPPFSLRVNQQRISRDDYLKNFSDDTNIISETQNGFILENPVPVEELPGFHEGFISVQDGAAQLAAELLEIKPHMRVLDACAAPGGKAAHIFEIEPTIELVAIDRDNKRLLRVQENFDRLQVNAEIISADAGDVKSWWDGKLFDRILLDAPCTGLGVIRRHPDIKLLRRFEDIQNLANEQKYLLNALWEVLAPLGLLLYITCSIIPEENFLMLKSFLETHPDAQELKIKATWGLETMIGRQILPGMHDMDGFYYGILQKM